MLAASGGLAVHVNDTINNAFSPVGKVEYYDTPYTVPSWGFKYFIYDNAIRRDADFHDDELIFAGNDQILSS